jgi:hypothetical protein
MADDNEAEAQECAYFGDPITDGSLEEAPRIDVPKVTILILHGKSLSSMFVMRCEHPTRLPMTFMLKTTLKTPFATELIASAVNSFAVVNMCANVEMQNVRLIDKSRFGISSPETLQSGSPMTSSRK